MQISAAYDDVIAAAAGLYLPQWEWAWLKAQLYQESLLDPAAESDAGAQGIAQFMPATWTEVARSMKLPAGASPFDPQYAIPAAAYYMARLRRGWWSPRPEDDRRRLAQASYNAGLGNVINAQRKAGNATAYAPIIAALPLITGVANAEQTQTYVVRIQQWHDQIVGSAQ